MSEDRVEEGDADEGLDKYRDDLVRVRDDLNRSYDKILVTLAGGAIGVSMVFLKDVVALDGVVGAGNLLFSWVCFVVSLAAVLGRITFGIEAYRKAIAQVDEGTIRQGKVGGHYALATRGLHHVSAIALVAGLVGMALFAYRNIGV